MNANTDTLLRRAAVVIAALDNELAQRVVDRLPPGHAALVRQVLEQLGPVSDNEQNETIVEFLRVTPSPTTTAARDGVELTLGNGVDATGRAIPETAASGLSPPHRSSAFQQSGARDSAPSPTGLAGPVPFDLHDESDIAALAGMLQGERPQTVAVCLSQLNQSQSTWLLPKLPDALRRESVARLGQLDEVDPLVVEAVLSHIRSWASEYVANRVRRQESVDPPRPPARTAVPRDGTASPPIAPTPGRGAGDRVDAARDAIDEHRAAVPDRPRGPNYAFRDLAQLDHEGITAVLREVGPEVVVLALAGADESMFQTVARLLPPAEVEKLRGEIANLGPTRIRDVDHAQQRMADAANRLAGSG